MSGSPKREDSFIQVPDSSPTSQSHLSSQNMSSPPQPVPISRLSSLKDRFAFKPLSSGNPNLAKQNVLLLKKRYPYISAEKIIEVFNASNRNLRETSAKLSLMPKPEAVPQPAKEENKASNITKTLGKYPQVSPVKDTKVILNKPSSSIAARYLNKNKFQTKINLTLNAEPENQTKKKRKLMRGSEMEEPEQLFIFDGDDNDLLEKNAKKSQKQKPVVSLSDSEEEKLLEEDDFDNSSDEDVVMDSEPTLFDTRVLTFLNTAGKRDIVDICGVTPAIADVLIKQRPFDSLYQIQSSDFENGGEAALSKNSRKKLMGEKVVDRTFIVLKGYDAVDSLIRKCSQYGETIASEIRKWGVGIDGKAGELELVEVDVEADDDVEEIREVHVVHDSKDSKKDEKPKEDVEEDDEDLEDDSDNDYSDDESRPRRANRRDAIRHNNNPKRYFKEKPALLSPETELKNYQQVGINWLNLLYQNNLSCILADEMGLGKTCQVIAFLAHLKELKYQGPHLVVVPSSTLENWLREFEKFCPSLVVVPYYGSQQERAEQRYELEDTSNYDVLVTTYNLATGNKYDQNFLRSCLFNVVVYDEGHMLKNSSSERYTKLMKLKANFRLLLTGTPLQNNLKELISLLAFILPDLFVEKKSDLVTLFDQKVTTKNSEDSVESDETYNPLLSEQSISKAKTMMTPFVLRRKKDQVLKHLPAKVHYTESCELSKEQAELYNGFVDSAKAAKERRLELAQKKEPVENLDSSPTNVIMQLRKAALHPLLFRKLFTDEKLREMSKKIMGEPEYVDANVQYIFEDMQVMSDFELDRLCLKFPKTLTKFLLPEEEFFKSGKIQKVKVLLDDIINKRNERVLVFSLFTQVLDILERCLSLLDIKFIRLDGQTMVNERQQIIDKFYQDDTIPVFLLSTKAGGFGINLVCANNVIIFDASFNPHDDKQAEDRCHRVGQTKEVNVYKLITEHSIEENILKMGESKLQLDQKVSEEELLLSLI